MLVFRRQQGESFKVGRQVEVRILRIGRGHVKVGVIAPREIEIFRTEISDLNRKAVVPDWSDPDVRQSLELLLRLLQPSREDPPSGPAE